MKFKSFVQIILFLSPITVLAEKNLSCLSTEDRILQAEFSKKQFFSSIGIAIDSTNLEQLVSFFTTRTFQLPETDSELQNPWYYLLKGYLSKKDSQERTFLFNKSLAISQENPAVLWLLYLEFSKNNLAPWVDKTLEYMQKAFFFSGANSNRYISNNLFQQGILCEKNNDKVKAQKLYEWAITFSPDKVMYWDRYIWVDFPSSPSRFLKKTIQYISSLAHSWQFQVEFLLHLCNFLSRAVFIFIISIIAVFSLKYFPYSLHSLSDLFPNRLPLSLRTFLTSAIIVSLISFGLIPFVWISTFLIWNILTKKEKILFTFILIFLITTPIFSFLRSGLIEVTSTTGHLQNYYTSINESSSETFCSLAFKQQLTDSTDNLNALSISICHIKKGNFNLAADYLERLRAKQPEDPLTLTVSGNLSFLNGDLKEAESQYKKALLKHHSAEILFNLGQCYLKQLKTIDAAEFMNEAAKENPALINSFVNTNDLNFSKNWPALRQVLFPTISNFTFWTTYFPKYSLNLKNASYFWRDSFLKLSPIPSFILMLILFSLLFTVFKQKKTDKRIKKLFECRFCGKVVCRKCKTGALCPSCYDSTQFISNEKSIENMRTIIWNKTLATRIIKTAILDLIIPGTGKLYEAEPKYGQQLSLILFSGIIYSSYIYIYFQIVENLRVHSFELILFLLPLLTYNIFLGSKRIIRTVKELRILLGNKNNLTQ